MLKVNNKDTKTTSMTSFSVFFLTYIFLVFLSLNLDRQISAGKKNQTNFQTCF